MNNQHQPFQLPESSEDAVNTISKLEMTTDTENDSIQDPNTTVSAVTHDEVFSEPDDAGHEHDDDSDVPATLDEENDGLLSMRNRPLMTRLL